MGVETRGLGGGGREQILVCPVVTNAQEKNGGGEMRRDGEASLRENLGRLMKKVGESRAEGVRGKGVPVEEQL